MSRKPTKKKTQWERRHEIVLSRKEAALKTVASLEVQGFHITEGYKEYIESLGNKTRYSEKEVAKIRNLTNANVIKSRSFAKFKTRMKKPDLEVEINVPRRQYERLKKNPVDTSIEITEDLINRISAQGNTRAAGQRFGTATKNLIRQSATLRDIITKNNVSDFDGEKLKTLFTPDVLRNIINELKASNPMLDDEHAAARIITLFLESYPTSTRENEKKYREYAADAWNKGFQNNPKNKKYADNTNIYGHVAVWFYEFISTSVWWERNKDKLQPSEHFKEDFFDIFSLADPSANFEPAKLERMLMNEATTDPKNQYKGVLRRYRDAITTKKLKP